MSTSTIKLVYSLRGIVDVNDEIFGQLNGDSPALVEQLLLNTHTFVLQKTVATTGVIIVPPVTNIISFTIGGYYDDPSGTILGGARVSPNYPTFLSLLPDATGTVGIWFSKAIDASIIPIRLIWL